MTEEEKILKVRARREAGEFERQVTERHPKNLEYDRIVLSCGHGSITFPRYRAAEPDRFYCGICAGIALRDMSPEEEP